MVSTTVGVISDTHGLVRPEALAALSGSGMILHAGDVGDRAVLEALETIAPVVAVRGNVDRGRWAERLPDREVVPLGSALVYLLHDVSTLDVDPSVAGFAAVVAGHSHRPGFERRQGVLFLNPGSAGPRRFRLPVTLARLHVEDGDLRPEIVDLEHERGR